MTHFKTYLSSFLVLIVTTAYSQITLKVVSTFSVNNSVEFFEVDQIGNIYCVNKNEIIKIDSKGKQLYRYSNMTYGNITELEVNNSLRPLVFYKEQSKIVVLDNTLSAQDNSINLDELNLYNTLTIANSNLDNGVWLYDLDFKQIVKVNTKLEVILESGNLAVLLNKENLQPNCLLEKNGRLYMSTKNDGVLIFDPYCSYLQSLDIQDAKDLQINEEYIIVCNENNLCSYNSISHKETHLNFPKKYLRVKKYKNSFIALNEDAVSFDVLIEVSP
jgi:hypothetical protein